MLTFYPSDSCDHVTLLNRLLDGETLDIPEELVVSEVRAEILIKNFVVALHIQSRNI